MIYTNIQQIFNVCNSTDRIIKMTYYYDNIDLCSDVELNSISDNVVDYVKNKIVEYDRTNNVNK